MQDAASDEHTLLVNKQLFVVHLVELLFIVMAFHVLTVAWWHGIEKRVKTISGTFIWMVKAFYSLYHISLVSRFDPLHRQAASRDLYIPRTSEHRCFLEVSYPLTNHYKPPVGGLLVYQFTTSPKLGPPKTTRAAPKSSCDLTHPFCLFVSP